MWGHSFSGDGRRVRTYSEESLDILDDEIDEANEIFLAASKCRKAMAELNLHQYKAVALSFLQVHSRYMNAPEIMSCHKIARYAGLCGLATFDRMELRKNLLDKRSFKPFLESEPEIRDAIQLFFKSKYSECLKKLADLRDNLVMDADLEPHVDTLLKEIRIRSIQQYFSIYSYADMVIMAEAFNVTLEELRKELVELITADRLQARIDYVDKFLVPHDPRDDIDFGRSSYYTPFDRKFAEMRAAFSELSLVDEEAEILQTRSKCTIGLAELDMRKYEAAALIFLQIDAKHMNAPNMISPRKLATYAGLCGLATFDRIALRKHFINDNPFMEILECELMVRDIIQYFYNSKYAMCFKTLDNLKVKLMMDEYFAPNVEDIFMEIRVRAIQQYFSTYSTVKIVRMADAFGTPYDQFYKELCKIITENKLQAYIDREQKLLIANDLNAEPDYLEMAYRVSEDFERASRAALLQSSVDVHNNASMFSIANGLNAEPDGFEIGLRDYEDFERASQAALWQSFVKERNNASM